MVQHGDSSERVWVVQPWGDIFLALHTQLGTTPVPQSCHARGSKRRKIIALACIGECCRVRMRPGPKPWRAWPWSGHLPCTRAWEGGRGLQKLSRSHVSTRLHEVVRGISTPHAKPLGPYSRNASRQSRSGWLTWMLGGRLVRLSVGCAEPHQCPRPGPSVCKPPLPLHLAQLPFRGQDLSGLV
eukprot:362504-Chlamydomonas_euryale.AAC.16